MYLGLLWSMIQHIKIIKKMSATRKIFLLTPFARTALLENSNTSCAGQGVNTTTSKALSTPTACNI